MSHEITLIEQCEVSPPPGSLSSTTLPLTFFDIPWFFISPNQRIFFYHFPHPTQHFIQTALPILKQSLSLSLQHFFPFVSNLIVPPNYHPFPYIRYLDGDSLSFTVAESLSNFDILVSDSQDAKNWHPLAPNLPPPRTEHDDTVRVIPLTAIQVTVFPNSGFSICLTFNHTAIDGKSLHQFIKYWASLCKSKANLTPLDPSLSLPSHERDRVKDPKGLKLIYLKELHDSVSKNNEFFVQNVYVNKIRRTIVLSREQVEKIKKWIALKSASETVLFHVSTFVVTCALIWVSTIKSDQSYKIKGSCDEEICYFAFSADCRDHPQLSIPSNYFGNCLAPLTVAVKRGELVKKDGVVVAANSIERRIRGFKSDALREVETLLSGFRDVMKPGQSVVLVAGSPKLAVYETDFGWGKPRKSDAVQTDSSRSISLSDSRDIDGGIEVGLALERNLLTDFINILEEQLHNICNTCE